MTATPHEPAPDSTPLMDALRFNADDLYANRSGRFSAAQEAAWNDLNAYNTDAAANASSKAPLIFIALVLLGIGGIMAVSGAFGMIASALGSLTVPLTVGVGLFVLFIFRAAMNAQRESIATVAAMGDASRGLPRVQLISGRAQTLHEVSYRSTGAYSRRERDRYYLVVGGADGTRKMLIGERGMGAFAADREYDVYYYDDFGIPTFLSAELR